MMLYPGGGYPALYWPPLGKPVLPGLPAEEHEWAVEVVTTEDTFPVSVVSSAGAAVGMGESPDLVAGMARALGFIVAVNPFSPMAETLPESVFDYAVGLIRGVERAVLVTTAAATQSAALLTARSFSATHVGSVTLGVLIETVHEDAPHPPVVVVPSRGGDWKVER